MEWLIATAIGALTAAGVYLALRPRTFDLVLGLSLISYAVNLFILASGRLRVNQAPLLDASTPTTLIHYADPLPQALVLTAIVISFAMTALLAVLALRLRMATASDQTDGVEPGEERRL
jgi:multicomponent K+:H+ antiporter subunit C